MKVRNDFNHDDLLDRAVDAVLREPLPDDPPPERIAHLVAQVRHAADQPYLPSLIERIRNMKPITRISVAAAAMIAIAALVSWLAPNGGTALAFDDIAKALSKVESATWKTESTGKWLDKETVKLTTTNMFLAPSHERIEMTTNGGKTKIITIIDGQKDTAISLIPAGKTATVFKLQNRPKESHVGKTFQGLRELVSQAQSGKAGKAEKLGEEVVNGRRAAAFHLQLGDLDVKLWADPKTLLPIRIEETMADPEMRIVMTDFQIDIELDKSLFSVDVPKGYTVRETAQFDASKKPIQYLADGLKLAAKCNDGVFPPELRGEHGIDGIILRGAAVPAKKKPAEDLKLGTDVGAKLGLAFGMLIGLRPENDWHYAGKYVKLGTPNRPIFWYRPAKEKDYQVLYADLSVKEVPPRDVPKIPSEGGRKP